MLNKAGEILNTAAEIVTDVTMDKPLFTYRTYDLYIDSN